MYSSTRRCLRKVHAWLGRVNAKFHQPSEPECQLHVSLQTALMQIDSMLGSEACQHTCFEHLRCMLAPWQNAELCF